MALDSTNKVLSRTDRSMTLPNLGRRYGGSSRTKEDGNPLSSVHDRILETKNVAAMPDMITRLISAPAAGVLAALRPGTKKNQYHSNKKRKPSVARDQTVGDDGDKTFPGRFYYTASCYSAGVASEAHAHGKGLFPVRAAFSEYPVEVECYARKITEVFEQGKEREKI